MGKVTIQDLMSSYTSVAKLNANLQTLAAAFDNTVSRDGTAPNFMDANLDMNNYRILNNPAPINDTDLVRLTELNNLRNVLAAGGMLVDGSNVNMTSPQKAAFLTYIGAASQAQAQQSYDTVALAKVATIDSSVSAIQVNRFASDRPLYPMTYTTTTGSFYNFTTNGGTKKWLVAQSTILTPLAFGSYGSGSHTITAPDITANPQWIGTYVVGTQWDTVAVQEAIYLAFASTSTPGSVVWNSIMSLTSLNRLLYLPGGDYNINKQLSMTASGFHIESAGRRAGRLVWSGDTASSLLYCNSASYGRFGNIGFSTGVSNLQALLELDWTGTPGGLKTQQLTIDTCMWEGNFQASNGCRISKSGGGAQGDTVVFINPYFGGFNYAGLALGVGSAQNTLGIVILGGDFQACYTHGIVAYGAQVLVDGTSFQNQSTDPTNNQIANGGADLTINGGSGAGGNSSMRNVRSESDVLCQASGTTVFIENATLNTGIPNWLPSHAYAAGSIVHGTPGIGQKGEKGRTFMCVVAGTSSATEPTWNSVSRGVARVQASAGVATTASAGTVTGNMSKLPLGSAPAVGDYIAIVGAAASSKLGIYPVTAVASSASITVGAGTGGVVPVNTLAITPFYVGTPFTDGTAKWIDVDYDSVDGAVLTHVSTGMGRWGMGCTIMEDSTAGRPDAIRVENLMGIVLSGSTRSVRNIKCTAGGLNENAIPFNPWVQDGYDNKGPLQLAYTWAGDGALNFDGGTGHNPYVHIEFKRSTDGLLSSVGAGLASDGALVNIADRPYVSSNFYDFSTGGVASGTPALDILYAYPMRIDRPITVTALGINVTVLSAGALKGGIYTDVNGKPGTLIVTTTNPISTSAVATPFENLTANTLLPAGNYWGVGVLNSTPTMFVTTTLAGNRSIGGTAPWTRPSGYSGVGTYAAGLPGTFPTPTPITTNLSPALALRAL